MKKKQFITIGLGRFGASIAKTIYSLGQDVLVIDISEDKIQEIVDNVTHAVQMDATDENALKCLGVSNFDVAIVTIGSNIQASTMVTLLVKEMGVKYIVAKATSDLHAKILYKIGADKVILPEQDMGIRVAHNLVSSNILDHIELSSDYGMIELEPPYEWINKSLRDIKIRGKYGINIVAIKGDKNVNISPSADYIIKNTDILVALGSNEDLSKFESIIVENK
ncbi:potassium channel family protein [Clostridium chromiireducens]|uniref:Ktr system potassium uptake protein A n=1 Tax=Clostridium chromiireducens TaxID=225345 RepID=A0A1V4IEC7_9CLOT|nr:TrkA family potassium uptake protein [Clostridium chromiireducens]MVX65366.1 TrkA family potassium uptake protein [Clostridium chromiireducens]OPJ58321.1 Ktr system potassium uptake protein A [Clostridium chromiireducens]